MIRPLIAGNWKMNGVAASLGVAKDVAKGLEKLGDGADCLLCPPATLLASMADAVKGSALKVGAQDCHTAISGAHTGDVSAEMVADAGGTFVILGHSERRADHGETDSVVAEKVLAALRAKLTPIICVGETLEQRDAGDTLDIIAAQLAESLPDDLSAHNFVVAYEPVWAIGTGRVATVEQIGEVHSSIRDAIRARFGETGASARILYGGSMKPGNAAEILAVGDVNGGLIGGASLKADDFLSIYAASVGGG